jgi:hypothetical protein
MGDRALVVFHAEETISPTVYLHWNGSEVPELLAELKERMQGRFGDIDYATARFIGGCHDRIPGNLSLGVFNNKLTIGDLNDAAVMRKHSHGDAGFVVVNVDDFSWVAYGGYLEEASQQQSVATHFAA